MERTRPFFRWQDGAIIDFLSEQGRITNMTHAFQYGTGVFEGIRIYFNPAQQQYYVFRLAEHFHRILRNARIVGLRVPYSAPELEAATIELAAREITERRAQGLPVDGNWYVRPQMYYGDEKIGAGARHTACAIYIVPFGVYNAKSEHGLHTHVSDIVRADASMIPPRAKICGLYVQSNMAKNTAEDLGFDEAILLNSDGTVAEGSAANIFLVRNGELWTPPESSNILDGITRKTIMEAVAPDLRIAAHATETIPEGDLYKADEAFFCGTGAEIEPIRSIAPRGADLDGGYMLPDPCPGRFTKQLAVAYFDIVYGRNPKYRQWLTPVFPSTDE